MPKQRLEIKVMLEIVLVEKFTLEIRFLKSMKKAREARKVLKNGDVRNPARCTDSQRKRNTKRKTDK